MYQAERRNGGAGLDGHLVGVGEIVHVEDGSLLVSIVGPGVVVCIWCPGTRIGTMAHFIDAAVYNRSQATARYGNVALPKAVALAQSGMVQGNTLEAHILGAAEQRSGEGRGAGNLAMARKVLRARGVRIVSEDVGGSKGRKVLFDTATGHVAVVKVHNLRDGDWAP